VRVTSRVDVTPNGIVMTSTTPGVIRKSEPIVSTVCYSAEDIVKIARAKLRQRPQKGLVKSLLAIKKDAAIAWVRYFLRSSG